MATFAVSSLRTPPCRHRIARVDRQVQNDLLELSGVRSHGPQPIRGPRLEHDPLSNQPLQHRPRAIDDVVQVQHRRLQLLLPAEHHELSRQVGREFRRLADGVHLRGARIARREVVRKHLDVPDDGRQQVVEIVRDAARELAHGFDLLRMAELRFEGHFEGDVPRDHEARRPAVERQTGNDHLDIDVLSGLGAVAPLAAEAGAANVIEKAVDVFRRVDRAHVHLQELVARVAVDGDRRAIDVEEAERLFVVEPHRLGTFVEEAAVPLEQ